MLILGFDDWDMEPSLMVNMRSFEENLALLAKLAVVEGVNLQPGQELILRADIGNSQLVHLVTAEAYRVGAKQVSVMYSDESVSVIRFEAGSDEAMSYAPNWIYDGMTRAIEENAAVLSISSANPSLLANIPPEKVAVSSRSQGVAAKRISEYIGGFQINWSIVGAASPAWAQQVFAGLPEEEALQMLWNAIFLTSRILEDDPIASWTAHCNRLAERMLWLNELKLDAVRFRGPGTDLHVGLIPGHRWIGGRGQSKNGVQCSPNIPTEEIFTMPHRERTHGVVRSTKPLSLRGQIVSGIEVTFENGLVTQAKAARGEETLQRLIQTDEGSGRLGEIALVPNSSAVSQSGVLFLNTLYDENAASHIALGSAIGENYPGHDDLTDEQRLTAGVNESLIHVDWMIGSSEIDVDGIHADGTSTPLMRAGEWVPS